MAENQYQLLCIIIYGIVLMSFGYVLGHLGCKYDRCEAKNEE